MAYELVQDITVSSATTSVSFTGLNFTSADDLLLVSDVAQNSAASDIYITVNGNNTFTNYYSQRLRGDVSSVSSDRVNLPRMSLTYRTSDKSYSNCSIKLTNNGFFTYQSNENMAYFDVVNNFNDFNLMKYNGTSTFTLSSITSITLTSASTANGIGTGSRFRLYKLVAEKVADITVSTATTSVDITGLSIDKGSEYMLVSDIGNTLTVGSDIYLYVNGNNTNTNYWTQFNRANGTSVSCNRVNVPELSYINTFGSTSYKAFNYTNIKLTNNGNAVYQTSCTQQYNYPTDLQMFNFNTTSTFTVSSITQLTITAGITNVIGVGSRFQLYKLR